MSKTKLWIGAGESESPLRSIRIFLKKGIVSKRDLENLLSDKASTEILQNSERIYNSLPKDNHVWRQLSTSDRNIFEEALDKAPYSSPQEARKALQKAKREIEKSRYD
jgi:hypothetical protein